MTDDDSECRHGDEGHAVCPARHSRGPRNPLRRRGHLLGRGRRPARGGAGGVTSRTGTVRLQLLSGVTSKTQPRGFHAKPGRTRHAWCGPFARAETPRVTRTPASTSVFLDTGLLPKPASARWSLSGLTSLIYLFFWRHLTFIYNFG